MSVGKRGEIHGQEYKANIKISYYGKTAKSVAGSALAQTKTGRK
ncbi:hypothetical protein [uncultured Clostridium sp.]|nr:hypothetical protein [uncultured Clostridium sp.]